VRQGLASVLRDPDLLSKLAPVELDRMLRLLRRARLLGRVAVQLEEGAGLEVLPGQAADQLSSARVMAEARARVGRWELDRLAWALEDLSDTPLIAMKGCAYLLVGTPNARGRMFADVDLLVPESRLPLIEEKLLARGWRLAELTPYDDLYYRRWTHELPPMTHVERSVEVDLHHGILMRTARLKPSSDLLFEAAREVPGSRFMVLAPVDMVLHAIVHLFYGGEMAGALRELLDIDELLRHFGATEPDFWGQFWPRVESLDLARPAFYGLRYAMTILGTPIPAFVVRASGVGAPAGPVLALMDWLVPRVLFPGPLDGRGSVIGVAHGLAYVRSHWVKMPPGTLIRHLAYKFYVRNMRPSGA